jgi:hypothetical protein
MIDTSIVFFIVELFVLCYRTFNIVFKMYYSKPMKEPVLTCTTKDYNTEINMQSCESKPQENSTIKKTVEVSIINILYITKLQRLSTNFTDSPRILLEFICR